MSRLASIGKGAAYTGGAIAAIGGALYAAEVLAARRVRRRDDPHAVDILAPVILPGHTLRTADGGSINVVETGNGPPIVLVHGVTLSMRTWVRQFPALSARGFRVIAVDQRGHGASIAGDSGHGVEHIGDDLALVLRELDLRDAILIGHSMGGIAVQSFAIRHPDVARERVRGLILLSTLCRTPVGSRSTQLRDAIEHVTRRAPDSTRLWKTKNLGFLLARIGFGREPYASEVELVRQMLRDCPHDTRVAATRSLIGIDLTDALAAISHPTLVVCGTADAITPPFHARQIHEAIAGSRLELVEGAGHMIMLERAELLHGLIHDFAREVAG
jgi:pimeloyl-ACP methyl ester carboxylesterase